jgi:hypothetical protein
MRDITSALAESRAAVDQILSAAERTGPAWSTPRAPGKWSPSQIVEHVARSLEESANAASGRPTKFPTFPVFVRPLVRKVFFDRTVRKGTFPKGKTNKAMNPDSGSATPAEARLRLEQAHAAFEQACRQCTNGTFQHGIFGTVSAADYARFMAMHTLHHTKQIGRS